LESQKLHQVFNVGVFILVAKNASFEYFNRGLAMQLSPASAAADAIGYGENATLAVRKNSLH